MDTPAFISQGLSNADVYTDLNSLNKIKHQEDKDAALKQVAQQFESLFVQMMLKSMRSANAVFEEGNFLNNQESQFFRDMHDQQLSLTLSHGKGVGIADVLYRQLSKAPQEEQTLVGSDAYSVEDVRRAVSHQVKDGADIFSSELGQKLKRQAGGQPDLNSDKWKDETSRVSLAQTPDEFVRLVTPVAEKMSEKYGFDPLVLIAQSALETGWGSYVLARNGEPTNNLFNIKADSQWQGEKVDVTALEFNQGVMTHEKSAFKHYDNLEESFEDYSQLILNKSRYQNARELLNQPDEYINAIHQAGYATDPQYSEKVMRIFNQLVKEQRDEA